MKTKQLVIGNLQVKNNVFMAPMAGYTDYGFRHLILELGAGLAYTEFVSAKGLVYNGSASGQLLRADGDIDNTVPQLFGGDPYFMRKAIEESEYLKNYKIIDINMGCPVPKLFNNGEGSGLLTDIKKAESVVKECVKSGKIITVKIRIGVEEGDDIATDYAKMCEDSGAKLVTIHGRVRRGYFGGELNYAPIERAKKSVNIPIIANGGIYTEEDADRVMDITGADGVMIARGGIINPFLISKLTNTETDMSLKDFIVRHVKYMEDIYSKERATLEFRKFVPYYFRSMVNAKELKSKIYSAKTTEEIIDIISQKL